MNDFLVLEEALENYKHLVQSYKEYIVILKEENQQLRDYLYKAKLVAGGQDE